MARRNPGGYGKTEDYVTRAESRYLREALQNPEEGWVIANGPLYSHLDVTGVTVTVGTLSLFSVPERAESVRVAEARIVVAALAANSTVEVGLFIYQDSAFRLVPGTRALIATTATGLKASSLAQAPLITPEMRLFIGVLSTGGNPVLEGFQAGTAIGRLLGSRTLATTSFPSMVPLATTSRNYTTDVPAVAFLARDAAIVL